MNNYFEQVQRLHIFVGQNLSRIVNYCSDFGAIAEQVLH